MATGIYAGSFDPLTNGHIDIAVRSHQFFDKLVIAVGINPNKKTLFSEEERQLFIRQSFAHFPNIKVASFQGLLVDYAKEIGATVLVRGIRSVSDFEYEMNLASINKTLAPDIETMFLPTSPKLAIVSSSMVKEVAKYGGDISSFVPKHVMEAIQVKFGPADCPKCGEINALQLTADIPPFRYCPSCSWNSALKS
jgi:pantetheine-phosphate adenylyltransferase